MAGEVNTFATNLAVEAGDKLGFGTISGTPGCLFWTGDAGDGVRGAVGDPTLGSTRSFPGPPVPNYRVNLSATLDPSSGSGGGGGGGDGGDGGDGGLDSSKTKGRQSADNLKLKLTADLDSTLDLEGKGKIARREVASTAAKPKKYKLKKKPGVQLQAGVEKVIPLKFRKHRKTLKRIKRLQRGSKKARKRSKVIVNMAVTTAAGVVSDSKLRIRLKS